jgi:hypothetical protein
MKNRILRVVLLVPGVVVMLVGWLWGVFQPFFESGRKLGLKEFKTIERGDE